MKASLGISSTDYDVFLTEQLQVVSDAVEGYCNRKFEVGNWVESIYADDVSVDWLTRIFTRHFPVNTITSIFEKADETDTGTELTGYRFQKELGRVSRPDGFFRSGRLLEITYNSGYATIPALIQSVVKSVVSERYNKKLNGIDLSFGSDVQSISIPGTLSISYDYSLSSNERKSAFGNILGNNLNILDAFRSERAVVGSGRVTYVN